MDNKSCKVAKSCENSHKFICKYCDYSTSRKSSWAKHLKTKKHIKKSLSKSYPTTMDNKKVANRYFCECGKSYQFMSGLSKHRKRCSKNMVTSVGHNLKKGTTLFSGHLFPIYCILDISEMSIFRKFKKVFSEKMRKNCG